MRGEGSYWLSVLECLRFELLWRFSLFSFLCFLSFLWLFSFFGTPLTFADAFF